MTSTRPSVTIPSVPIEQREPTAKEPVTNGVTRIAIPHLPSGVVATAQDARVTVRASEP